MPPYLKKSTKQAQLESGTHERIVTHLERHLELNSLDFSDETQIKTVTHKQQIEGNKDYHRKKQQRHPRLYSKQLQN